ADEIEFSVVADAEYRQAGRHEAGASAVLHRQSRDVRGDQQASARIDVKVAAMDAVRIDMLDRAGLAGRRIDREDRQRVLAADKNAGLVRRGGAVRDIG